jgi:hypothetical protein
MIPVIHLVVPYFPVLVPAAVLWTLSVLSFWFQASLGFLRGYLHLHQCPIRQSLAMIYWDVLLEMMRALVEARILQVIPIKHQHTEYNDTGIPGLHMQLPLDTLFL